jgi:hypothetical protein
MPELMYRFKKLSRRKRKLPPILRTEFTNKKTLVTSKNYRFVIRL